MKHLRIANDIIPVGQFKAGLARYIKEIHTQKNSLIITQNGKPAAVLITPAEFDELRHSREFIESIGRGLADSEEGNVFSSAQVRSRLKSKRSRKEQ